MLHNHHHHLANLVELAHDITTCHCHHQEEHNNHHHHHLENFLEVADDISTHYCHHQEEHNNHHHYHLENLVEVDHPAGCDKQLEVAVNASPLLRELHLRMCIRIEHAHYSLGFKGQVHRRNA